MTDAQDPEERRRTGGATLMIAHRVPYPPDRGDKIRGYHLLSALARLGPVDLAALADDERDCDHANALRPWTRHQLVVPRNRGKLCAAASALVTGRPLSVELFANRGLRAFVDERLNDPTVDTVLIYSGQMAAYVRSSVRQRLIVDFVDVDSAKFAAYARNSGEGHIMRKIYAREAKRLARFEAAVAHRADAALFVSDAEAALFRGRATGAADKVAVVENGIDFRAFDPAASLPLPDRRAIGEPSENATILFTGQMDYRPNVEAVVFFAREVMPRIRHAHPDARFLIVGRAPTADVRALSELNGVAVIGEVADVRSWLAAADLVVAPLLTARGIQNKVLEGMAMARAVLATSAAAEGIDAVPDRDLVIADGAASLAQAAIALLADPDVRAAIGAAARAQVVARYDWARTLAPLADILDCK